MGRILYLQCGMGAAGDMLAAALYELLEEKEKALFCQVMKESVPEGVEVIPEPCEKCGILGTHMKVLVHGQEEGGPETHDAGLAPEHRYASEHSHDHEQGHEHEHYHEHGCGHGQEPRHGKEHRHSHAHASLAHVNHLIDCYKVASAVKERAKAVYARIAQAEGTVHGREVSEIHFHEVGALDAIADVMNVCWLADRLGADQIVVSPINVGFGEVRCAHGILPVPAPATALLLQGAPCYPGSFRGEMCTPTGAALLQELKTSFGEMPPMILEKAGYGMGRKDYPQVNCVRAILGRQL